MGISIHAPREGGDQNSFSHDPTEFLFQSTPPARGATIMNLYDRRGYLFQSTPPARGATAGICLPCCFQLISIHAPREGGDTAAQNAANARKEFQSTPPARGATKRGGTSAILPIFQSTPPARGATMGGPAGQGQGGISIHAPARGATAYWSFCPLASPISIHAPPRGGRRPLRPLDVRPHRLFQSTPPARGATPAASGPPCLSLFQSTPPARGATPERSTISSKQKFQSTPPARGATALVAV